MVEDQTVAPEAYVIKEVEIHYDDPEKHVELIKPIGSINGIDDLGSILLA